MSRLHITDEMIQDCIDNPVASGTHDWDDGQQAEYDLLKSRGRTLYDNLRTKYDVGHIQAYVWAADLFGKKGNRPS